MADSAGKKTGNIIVWVLMALLIVGLGGFGASNFGGTTLSIGKVGDESIDINDYARGLQNALRAHQAQTGENLTMLQADAQGLTAQVRAQLISTAALDNETANIGLSVGDETVRQDVLNISAFQGIDGNFDRESYRFALENANLNESQFEEQIRKETSRGLLQGALMSGITLPEGYSETLFSYFASRRSYSVIELGADNLDAPVAVPDAAALQAFYDDNAPAFTAPETKEFTYAWISPDEILDTVEVDDGAIRALYEERIDDYVQPERRLVERLVFGSADEAQAAHDRLSSDDISFDDLVIERGLALTDIDLGDVSAQDLGAAADAVFALTGPGLTAPTDSDLGPAIFRMNAVLAAREVTFEQARPDLHSEAAADRARRVIADMITDIDDQLAAGATLEELANDTEMQLGTIGYFPGNGDDIAAYESFRAAAEAARDGDFPEVLELDDGGIFALRLDQITPPTLRPLDDVRAEAITGWQQAETAKALQTKADALVAKLNEGALIDGLGLDVTTQEALTRGGISPLSLVEPIFGLEARKAVSVTDAETVYVVQLNEILPPDTEDQAGAFLREALVTQAAQGAAQDLFSYFSQALIQDAGLSLDQHAINAVHAQFP